MTRKHRYCAPKGWRRPCCEKRKRNREAIQKICKALGGSHRDASAYLIAIRYIEALQEMASGDQSRTVYLPYEATGVMGALGGMKDLFGPGRRGGGTPNR